MTKARKWTTKKPVKPGWYFYRANSRVTYAWLWTVVFLMPPTVDGDQATFEGANTEPVLYNEWFTGGQWATIEEAVQ